MGTMAKSVDEQIKAATAKKVCAFQLETLCTMYEPADLGQLVFRLVCWTIAEIAVPPVVEPRSFAQEACVSFWLSSAQSIDWNVAGPHQYPFS